MVKLSEVQKSAREFSHGLAREFLKDSLSNRRVAHDAGWQKNLEMEFLLRKFEIELMRLVTEMR